MITLPGVDLAVFQGPPGQWKPHAQGIAWAAVKFTELSTSGPYTNPECFADWATLKAMGAGRIAYLFGHPAAGPLATVSLFLDAAGPVLADGDGVAIDLEVNDSLPPDRVAAWALEVATLLEHRTGRRPVLYTFLSFAEAGNCAGLGHLPLWISNPSSPAGKPGVPAPWKSWVLHQYDITGDIDRDVAAFPSVAAMRAALGRAAPKPPVPKPPTTDSPEDLMLLNTGQGAVTPLAFRDSDTHVRFMPAGATKISVAWHGSPAQQIALGGGPGEYPIPSGCRGAVVTRLDAGPAVSVVAQ